MSAPQGSLKLSLAGSLLGMRFLTASASYGAFRYAQRQGIGSNGLQQPEEEEDVELAEPNESESRLKLK